MEEEGSQEVMARKRQRVQDARHPSLLHLQNVLKVAQSFPSSDRRRWILSSQLSPLMDLTTASQVAAAGGILPGHRVPHFSSLGLRGVDEQRKAIKDALEAALNQQGNASVLIQGPRGCGKSAVLSAVLQDLTVDRSTSLSFGRGKIVVVYLDGAVIENDAQAMTEIARQISLSGEHIDLAPIPSETAVEKEADEVEDGESDEEEDEEGKAEDKREKDGVVAAVDGVKRPGGNFHDQLTFIVSTLKEGKAGHIPMLLVLDNFHCFAHPKKQTLLYSLFDLTHSSKVRMAIVGITPRMDAINMLEKRLWSRFSHRRVLVSRPDFVTLCKVLENALCLPLEAVEQGLFTEEEVQQHNSAVAAAIAASEVQSRLRRAWRGARSMRFFLEAGLRVVRGLEQEDSPTISSSTVIQALDELTFDHVLNDMRTLSLPEATLLCAAVKWEETKGTPMSLHMVLEQLDVYKRQEGIAALGMVMSKLTAEKAWERLFALCIIRPVGVASATASLAGPLNDATGGSAAVAMTSSHHRRTTDGPVARASPVVDIHAAHILGVEPATVRKAVNDGYLELPTDLESWMMLTA